MHIKPLNDRGVYLVTSRPGHSYVVEWRCSDDDGRDVWRCECPAAAFRPKEECKHIQAIRDARQTERTEP